MKERKIYITSDGFVAGHLKKAFKKNLTDDIKKAGIVINTVGILKEEKHTYEHSHIEYVKNLIPQLKNKKLIHISALGSRHNHPSRYKHTKAVAENIIVKNHKNHAIIKPSIILGEGQKLYDDLKKFKNLPIVLAPKMKVAPLNIEDLITLIKKIIKNDLNGVFEICGKEKTMKELFSDVFATFGKKPYILEMPKPFFLIMLPVLSAFNILSWEEYLMIEDNICKDKNGQF